MKTHKSFESGIERYAFDFNRCHFDKGWAQLDTKNDASYYGNWVNPFERKITSYVEGDITVQECETDEEFISLVRETVDFHKKQGSWKGIDSMCRINIEERMTELGLADCLYPDASAQAEAQVAAG